MQKPSSLKDFEVLTRLGEGAFGVVHKVRRKEDGKEYALKKVKLIAMKQKQRQNAVNEIRILASLNDDYIIGYKDAFYDDASSTLCVVMEFASGGDILKKINQHTKARTRFSEDEIWKALVHMAKGLKSLHDKKILHRDLKCANVFINSDGVYKLGDLNVSKVLKKGMAYTQTGTPYYASPEVWQDKPYDMKSDIWSLGCVVYEMAALRPPFQASDLQGLFKKVVAGVFDRIPSVYSSDLANFVASLLKVSPQQRPTSDQILSNPIVARHYKEGKLESTSESYGSNGNGQLLQTIKFNPYNLKALKDKLPRSNYLREDITDRKSQAGSILDEADPLKIVLNQREKESLQQKNRDRVLSACGVRAANFCDSPRVPKKDEEHKRAAQVKLPPRPSGNNANGVKLPPKPVPSPVPYYQPSPRAESRDGKVNQSLVEPRRNSVKQSKESEGLYKQYLNDKSRQRSKEHLRNVGANIVAGGNPGLPRSNSVQKVQPGWWG